MCKTAHFVSQLTSACKHTCVRHLQAYIATDSGRQHYRPCSADRVMLRAVRRAASFTFAYVHTAWSTLQQCQCTLSTQPPPNWPMKLPEGLQGVNSMAPDIKTRTIGSTMRALQLRDNLVRV